MHQIEMIVTANVLMVTMISSPVMTEMPGIGTYVKQHSGGVDDKIAGGQRVSDLRDFAFMVIVYLKRHQVCGGSLVTLKLVLSAAHCYACIIDGKAQARDVADYKFIAGTLRQNPLDSSYQNMTASVLYFHPKFTEAPIKFNDAGVALMMTEFVKTPYVEPIQLPGYGITPYRRRVEAILKGNPDCKVAGWGLDIGTSNSLNMATVKPVSDLACHDRYAALAGEKYRNYSFKNHDQLCFRGITRNFSINPGDSGGPVVCDYTLMGVMSFGAHFLPVTQEPIIILNILCELPSAAPHCSKISTTTSAPQPRTSQVDITTPNSIVHISMMTIVFWLAK